VLNNNQIDILIAGIREASKILMGLYKNPQLDIRSKEDLSPVTEADLASNAFISKLLSAEFPGIPLISEEGIKEDYRIRKNNEYSWILDPLDGTSEFISENDEFAINLALLHYDQPVFGIIAIPAKDVLYYAIKGEGSWRVNADGISLPLPLTKTDHLVTRRITVLISRSHAGQAELDFCEALRKNGWIVDSLAAGSAYKHVLLAEGSADLYYKPGICWEWDTAPGQIIIEEAGGSVRRIDDGQPMVYNKEDFMNPGFIMWAPGVFIPL
jgi:3'(2'), 5'-bisphosphate nucleotidase